MGPVEEVRITTFSFNRILRNGAYHLTTWRRLAEDWNPQLQIRGNLTTLTFENIIFINQLLPDTLHFIYLFIVLLFRSGAMRPKTQAKMRVRNRKNLRKIF